MESAIQRGEIAMAGAVAGEFLFHDLRFMKKKPEKFKEWIAQEDKPYMTGRNISIKAALRKFRKVVKSSVVDAWKIALEWKDSRLSQCTETLETYEPRKDD